MNYFIDKGATLSYTLFCQEQSRRRRNWRGNEMTDTGQLYKYETGDFIRPATEREVARSIMAATRDGGSGVIAIEIDGEDVSCYATGIIRCDVCRDKLTTDQIERNLLENDEQDGNSYICCKCT